LLINTGNEKEYRCDSIVFEEIKVLKNLPLHNLDYLITMPILCKSLAINNTYAIILPDPYNYVFIIMEKELLTCNLIDITTSVNDCLMPFSVTEKCKMYNTFDQMVYKIDIKSIDYFNDNNLPGYDNNFLPALTIVLTFDDMLPIGTSDTILLRNQFNTNTFALGYSN
jgi:hypothetical protein